MKMRTQNSFGDIPKSFLCRLTYQSDRGQSPDESALLPTSGLQCVSTDIMYERNWLDW